MDATISLRIFGRRNNWFSRPLQQPTSSLRFIIVALGTVMLVATGILFASYQHKMRSLGEEIERLHTFSALVQQIVEARLRIQQTLVLNTPDNAQAGEMALENAMVTIEAAMATAQPADYITLSRMQQSSSDALNVYRSLGSLVVSSAPDDTRQVVRQQLEATTTVLQEQGDVAYQQILLEMGNAIQDLSSSIVVTGLIMLIVLLIFFAFGYLFVVIITQHAKVALHKIGQAAQQLALERYDTHIDLSGETNADIVYLGEALNRMAENLRKAMRSESDAQKQNQLQLMKLAKEERKTAVLEERQRIARELHDSVKQQLFSITLSAKAAMNLLDHAPKQVHTYLDHIAQAGHQAQSEMTALVQELVPVSMQEKRLDDALLAYLTPLCEIHNLKFLWRVVGTNTLTLTQEHTLFRAVQEAVSNVVRHSEATVLHVSCNFGLITHVIIEDNGKGFVPDAVPVTSSGLALMRTRLMRAGGRYELQTTVGAGTRLTLLMDLRRASNPNTQKQTLKLL